MITEITYLAFNEQINDVTVGVFPSKGRYFRKKMDTKDGIFYRTEVALPDGRSFYQLYGNNNYTEPLGKVEGIVSIENTVNKNEISCDTDIFCPFIFFNNRNYCSQISDNLFELRVITSHRSITNVYVVNENLECFPMKSNFQSDNKVFWSIQIDKTKLGERFIFNIFTKSGYKFFHADNEFRNLPEFADGFLTSDIYKNESTSQTFSSRDVGYQIFPDRFRRSDSAAKEPYFFSWEDKPDHYAYYGGDLKGILEKLDYLGDLGIGFI